MSDWSSDTRVHGSLSQRRRGGATGWRGPTPFVLMTSLIAYNYNNNYPPARLFQIQPRPSFMPASKLAMTDPLKPSTPLPPGVVPSESRQDFEALVDAEAKADEKDPKNLVKEV